jgi:hypothetical protein
MDKLNELREALYLLQQLPAGSKVGPDETPVQIEIGKLEEEIASLELELFTPINAELLAWAENSNPPEDFPEEERPW